jgi:Zn-dependent peptidase ImmA (M78 family)
LPFNSAILRDALKVRSLTPGELSVRLGLSEDDLRRQLGDDGEPGMGLVGAIAKELSVPKFLFFMSKPPELAGALPDFRSDRPKVSAKSRATVEAIQLAQGIQHSLAENRAAIAKKLPALSFDAKADMDATAFPIREFFGLTLEDQLDAKDARTFYTVVRKRVEDAGILVMHASFPPEDGSGFCLYDRQYPVIVVNTKSQNRGRRLFTLIHELAHILMGVSGISDPFVGRNAVERFCNKFAGAFLVPKQFVSALLKNVVPTRDPDLADVTWVSRRLKISQEASVTRLEELGHFNSGSHSNWLAAVKSLGLNHDFKDKGGGPGKPPPPEKTKLAKYGFRFASAFGDLLGAGAISQINLFRSTGLKPAYQRAYFDYARSLSSKSLHDLELEDE